MASQSPWQWDSWVDGALSVLASKRLLRSSRAISLRLGLSLHPSPSPLLPTENFDGPGPWDRSSVELTIDGPDFHRWLSELPPGPGAGATTPSALASPQPQHLLLFSGNDYLALSSHPAVAHAASQAALHHGMGPRGSALICGYTDYHRSLEASLAQLKNKHSCLLCPTGFAANLAFLTALGSIASLLSPNPHPTADDRIAIFSDELNHASIIDGIRLAHNQSQLTLFVYRHCDMLHLDSLLY